ncbi:hypothetical protein RUND412_009001 [Rhizina undulata]
MEALRARAEEVSSSAGGDLNSDLSNQTTISTLRTRISTLKSTLPTSKKRIEEELRAHKHLQIKLGEERVKWEEERVKWEEHRLVSTFDTFSPTPSQPQSQLARKTSGPLSTTESFFLGFTRSNPASSPQPELDSGLLLPQLGLNMLRTSLRGPRGGGRLLGEHVHALLDPSGSGPDIFSVSTIITGPSIPLVKRMAATVRRLEMEIAGSREEITQMVAQRDEARR